ncbi:MAG: hypothetical protein ACRDRA_14795 [Pseudonocardiaceae bacterium]
MSESSSKYPPPPSSGQYRPQPPPPSGSYPPPPPSGEYPHQPPPPPPGEGYPPPPPSGEYPPPPPGEEYPPPSGGEYPPAPKDDCPDPFEPYTDYRVAVSVAKERSDLYAADAAVIDPKYQKLDGAQKRYETAWAAQRAGWEDLKCRLKRIGETLDRTLDDKTRKHLWDCWKKVRDETGPATAPTDCREIDDLSCDDVEELLKGGPSADDVAKLRWLETLAATCVAQGDTAFDELADFPAGLEARITALKDRVTQLDEGLASPGNDPRRSYVEYLAIQRDVSWLEQRLITAAKYACNLKAAFVALLRTHRTAICIKVAIHAIDKRTEIEAQAKNDKAKNFVDLVLECARDEPAEGYGTAPPEQGEQPYKPAPGAYAPTAASR